MLAFVAFTSVTLPFGPCGMEGIGMLHESLVPEPAVAETAIAVGDAVELRAGVELGCGVSVIGENTTVDLACATDAGVYVEPTNCLIPKEIIIKAMTVGRIYI